MDPLLYGVTLLILLRAAHEKFPPVCVLWSFLSTEELWDVHYILALKWHGDAGAETTFAAVERVYHWTSLRQGLSVLKEIWFRYVKEHRPLPVKVLQQGEWLQKGLRGTMPQSFPDSELAEPWDFQCEMMLQNLLESGQPIEPLSTAGRRTLEHPPSVIPVSEFGFSFFLTSYFSSLDDLVIISCRMPK